MHAFVPRPAHPGKPLLRSPMPGAGGTESPGTGLAAQLRPREGPREAQVREACSGAWCSPHGWGPDRSLLITEILPVRDATFGDCC